MKIFKNNFFAATCEKVCVETCAVLILGRLLCFVQLVLPWKFQEMSYEKLYSLKSTIS